MKTKNKHRVETGYFKDSLPYVRIGDNPKVVMEIEAISFKNEPSSGFALKQFVKSSLPYLHNFTFYLVGRKPNSPENYSFDQMADDYAIMIKREFKEPVNIIGSSTGGQLAHYLAANHPDVVKKLVIIAAAYRMSEMGVKIVKKCGNLFEQGKYGKSFTTLLDLIWSSKIKKAIAKFFTRIVSRKLVGNIKYPNDLLNEIKANTGMNFKNRLREIKAPTLILSGEDDICYAAEDVRVTAEGIPNAKLILYKGYGHGLFMTNRKQVFKDIIQFLDEV